RHRIGRTNQNSRGPPQDTAHPPADQRAAGGTQRMDRRKHGDRSTSPVFGKEGRQQRRSAAEDQCRADPLQKPAKEQPAEARRRGAAEEAPAIPQQTDTEDAGMPEYIANPPEREPHARVREDSTDNPPRDQLDRTVN